MFSWFKKKSASESESGPALFFRNTATKAREVFAPLAPPRVTVYSCGPTVYGPAHIGNLRAYVFADTLNRVLRLAGYDPVHVINITDVGHLTQDSDDGEDKVEVAAKTAGVSAEEVVQKYTDEFFSDLALLSIEKERYLFPRATEHIAEQIALIQKLEKNGYAYKTGDGVYFDTSKFERYGALVGKNDGAHRGRIPASPEKRSSRDFALWKFSPKGEKRLQEWDSPWGVGFPGWHAECSAMAIKLLGETIDIHTGGEDHIAIHHTNEIAQSEGATGKDYVRYWLHNAFLTIGGAKIAKSAGNFITLTEIMARDYDPLALRYLFLEAHYRTPQAFSFEALTASSSALERLRRFARELESKTSGAVHPDYMHTFATAVFDDLNTPKALGTMWSMLRSDLVVDADKRATLEKMDEVLGLSLFEQDSSSKSEIGAPEDVVALARERETYRKAGDFKKADKLREKLLARGYVIRDTAEGYTLEQSSIHTSQ